MENLGQCNKHFDWDGQTVFKDAVLGYITVQKAVSHELIDHKIFQRLQDVAQTGMATLYPGATHNRFCHSIGVYYLGKQAFQNFQQNVKTQQEDIYYKVAHDKKECERVWNRWRFLFEISCLLHDCGHSPLSHSLEFLYDVARDYEGITVNKILLKAFEKSDGFKEDFVRENPTSGYGGKTCGAPHERMSACLIVLPEKEGGYREILKSLIVDQMRYFNETIMLDSGSDSNSIVYNDEQLFSDLEFIVRAIIGCTYKEKKKKIVFWGAEGEDEHWKIVYQLRNCIIKLLNGTIDVDNIDYSIRDATASGYKSSQVDYERLIKANTIALAYELKRFKLQDVPFDYSVRLEHFVSEKATENSPVSMTISGSATLLIQDESFQPEEGYQGFQKRFDGLQITGDILEDDEHSSDKNVRVIHICEGSSVCLKLTKGNLEIRPRDKDRKEGTQLYIQSSSLSGEITGIIFMGTKSGQNNRDNRLRDKISNHEKLKIYSAYHKSALSVIQGALDAANFESRWIYSHHVTTYYNNFLSVFLLAKYADFCVEEECRSLLQKVDYLLETYGNNRMEIAHCASAEYRVHLENELINRTRESLKSAKDKGFCISDESDESFSRDFQKDDADVVSFLLDILNVLCSIRPISSGQENCEGTLEWEIDKSINKIIDLVDKLSLTVIENSLLRQLKNDIYRKLKNDLKNYADIRKQGMPTMSALLGMPNIQTVNGRKYYRISDSDLRSMYHSLVYNATDEQKDRYADLFDAISQYESRQYLLPMWKSHAEFQFYVQGWKEEWFQPQSEKEAKTRIESFFDNDTSPVSLSSKKERKLLYTYFSKKEKNSLGGTLQRFWSEVQEKFYLDVLVYVPQEIRHKELSGSDTYVIWKSRVVSLNDIGFQISQAPKHDYFYLYYRQTKEAQENPELRLDVSEFMKFLQEKLEGISEVSSSKD